MSRHAAILLRATILASLSSLAAAQPPAGREQFLDRIETRLVMPAEALPLDRYSRSYF